MSGADELKWARRVRPELVRRLYTLDAKGIVDEELIDEAGYALYARCESIRIATEAHFGRAACRKCGAVIERRRWPKDELLVCACGWQRTWREYHKSYQRKQLVGGKAFPDFLQFLDAWPKASTPRDKLLLIDRLVHALHVDARKRFFRPAAVNVIEGSMRHVNQLLRELAYGPGTTPGVRDTRESWSQTLADIGESMREYWDARAKRTG